MRFSGRLRLQRTAPEFLPTGIISSVVNKIPLNILESICTTLSGYFSIRDFAYFTSHFDTLVHVISPRKFRGQNLDVQFLAISAIWDSSSSAMALPFLIIWRRILEVLSTSILVVFKHFSCRKFLPFNPAINNPAPRYFGLPHRSRLLYDHL